MIYYLLDASAVLLRYSHEKSILDKIHLQKIKKKAFLYLPNFCVPEIFNAFAKWYYREAKILKKEYEGYRNSFHGDVTKRYFLYVYDLHRYHNFNADLVYEAEHTTQPLVPTPPLIPKGKCSLSSFDILIIGMGMELKKIHAHEKVFVVTNDERLANVSNSKPDLFAPAIYLKTATLANLPSPN